MLKEYDKSRNKEEKNALSKQFTNLEHYIRHSDMHDMDKFDALEKLNALESNLYSLSNFHELAQLQYHSIIADKNSETGDLQMILQEQNSIRKDSYLALIELHDSMSTQLSEREWKKLVTKIKKIA